MPQVLLPIFPHGVTEINALLAVKNENGQVVYFNGCMPIFSHDEYDKASFKMITAQFCVNAKQVEIMRAFGVTTISVKRAVKCYRQYDAKGFFAPQRRRGSVVFTEAVLVQAQLLLDDGLSGPEVAEKLGIKPNTFSKAVKAGRLHVSSKKKA
jgi:hypothetical protein